MNKIKAIFFDYDNTLVNYMQADILALTRLAESLPDKIEPGAFIESAGQHIMAFHNLFSLGLVNPGRMHTYRLANTFQDYGLEWRQDYLEIYLDCYLNNHYIYPGAIELLKSLSGQVKLGIVTNSYLVSEQKVRIQRSGLGQHFDDILVCAEIGQYKPAPRAFLHLVDKYNLVPGECIYVGDSEKYDIQGAKNAGLISVRLVHNQVNASTAANYLCHNFRELANILSDLLSNCK